MQPCNLCNLVTYVTLQLIYPFTPRTPSNPSHTQSHYARMALPTATLADPTQVTVPALCL